MCCRTLLLQGLFPCFFLFLHFGIKQQQPFPSWPKVSNALALVSCDPSTESLLVLEEILENLKRSLSYEL